MDVPTDVAMFLTFLSAIGGVVLGNSKFFDRVMNAVGDWLDRRGL